MTLTTSLLPRACLATFAVCLCQCGTEGFFDLIATSSPGSFSESCAQPTSGAVMAVELSAGRGDILAPDAAPPYTPLNDDDRVPIVIGGQGSPMIVLVIRVLGANGQTCVTQRTFVTDESGNRVSFNVQPRPLTPQTDGAAISAPIFFPGEYRAGVINVRVELGGVVLTRRLRVS